MESRKIRNRFLRFFEERGHAIIPSASLVPEGDSSTLFTTAGMQPLVPYLLGQKHPKGKRLVNVQKCLRTGDIDEVGDSTHLTFFEMLGNWSLGDYFKKEAIAWSYELLIDEFGLDPKRLYVSVFEGDKNAPRDEESADIWKAVGVPEDRIYYRSAEDNWWSPGDNGPCGPDTEMFYDVTEKGLGNLSPEAFEKADDEQQVLEIWNDVFMEYEKKDGKVIGKLKQKNVDTGAGLERITTVLQNKNNVFETDLFTPILNVLPDGDEQARRIIADHIRAVVFMIADGVEPSNTDRGYVLRRLLRRSQYYYSHRLGEDVTIFLLAQDTIKIYEKVGYDFDTKKTEDIILDEEARFKATIEKGLKEFEKMIAEGSLSGEDAFTLFATHGFPLELTLELALEQDITVDKEGFQKAFKEHQEASRTATAGKFKGGLGDHSEETVKLHTAHHLLLAALQKVLGKEVKQRGSNITPERLRIDFSFDRKLTDEEKQKVEDQVNEWIDAGLEVIRKEMPREEAEKIGAEMEFGQKYPDVISVYFIQDADGNIISKEFCGGPHVTNTKEIGGLKIKKETSSAAGVRRIKAVLV